MRRNTYSGQIGLLLLVIMGVVVALVLSIASRSLSDTVLSRQEKESSVAFSLAETGVENALSLLNGNPDLNTEASITNLQYKIAQSTTYDMYVKELDTAHLNMTGFNTANPLTISWTKKNDASEDLSCTTEGSGGSAAAIEVSAINTTSNYVMRSYYRPSNCSTFSNGFSSSSDGGANFRSTVTYNVPASTNILRIKPIYAGATISVSGNGLTNQQYVINSKATGGDAQKEIEVKRGLEAAPAIFDYAVFANGTIVK